MPINLPPAEQLLDTIPCGLVSLDINGRVWYCNLVFQHLTGYAADEIIGQKIEKMLTLAGKVFFQTHLLPRLRLQESVEEVYVSFKAKNGQALPMLLNGKRIGEGEQLIIHCSCFPLNHRIRYEEQLLQEKRTAEASLQEKDDGQIREQLAQERNRNNRHLRELKDRNNELLQFQKLISHDISEQIRKVLIFMDSLFVYQDQEQDLTPRQKSYRLKINAGVHKIKRLFDYLSQFIALSEKEEPVIIDLRSIIRQAFTTVQSRYPDMRAGLSLDAIPAIKALPAQLEQLFVYLLDNSFKFSRAQLAPHVTIATCILPYNSLTEKPGAYRYEDYLQILYTDNSQGFEEKFRDEVFVLMNRITTKSTGGLGLAFCKKIINNHHGAISISTAPHAGVQVKIYLPV